jgi:cytosine deaminase
MDEFVSAAHDEAKASLAEGGFPVGSVVVKDGKILGRGHNRYTQTGDPTTHAEIEAIRSAAAANTGTDAMAVLQGATCYTTMMPCEMCSGAIVRLSLSKVVVAEVSTYTPADTLQFLRERGITVEILDEEACKDTVQTYYDKYPEAQGSRRPSDHRS